MELDDKVSAENFLRCLKAGIQCWELAGKVLVQLRAQNQNIFKELIQHAPWLTVDILHAFHRIGEGKLYPQVLLLRKCPAEVQLLSSDYETQRSLCNAPVEVVVSLKNNQPVIEKRWVREISKETTKILFKDGHLRTPQEQVQFMRNQAAAPIIAPPPEKDTQLNPIVIPKKLISLGCWSIVLHGDEPVLIKESGLAPIDAQTVTLHPHANGQTLLGKIEFKKWVNT